MTNLQSGMTLQPSLARIGVDEWISSLPGSHANQVPSPANEREQTTTDGSGPTSRTPFAKWDQNGYFLRTYEDYCQSTLDEGLQRFSEDWPTSGTMLNGCCYRRENAERLTEGSESLSWPTATNRNWKGKREGARRGFGADLNDVATGSWPTARVSAGHGPSTKELQEGNPKKRLKTEAELFHHGPQAPRSGIYGPKSSGDGPNSPQLWPTANAQGGKGYKSGSNRDTWRPTLEGAALGLKPKLHDRTIQKTPIGMKLNPLFVEWLMGLPIGWTDLEPVETRWSQWWLAKHSRYSMSE